MPHENRWSHHRHVYYNNSNRPEAIGKCQVKWVWVYHDYNPSNSAKYCCRQFNRICARRPLTTVGCAWSNQYANWNRNSRWRVYNTQFDTWTMARTCDRIHMTRHSSHTQSVIDRISFIISVPLVALAQNNVWLKYMRINDYRWATAMIIHL